MSCNVGVGQGEYGKYGLLLIYDVETGKRERKVKPHLVDWRVSLLEFSPGEMHAHADDGADSVFGPNARTHSRADALPVGRGAGPRGRRLRGPRGAHGGIDVASLRTFPRNPLPLEI